MQMKLPWEGVYWVGHFLVEANYQRLLFVSYNLKTSRSSFTSKEYAVDFGITTNEPGSTFNVVSPL